MPCRNGPAAKLVLALLFAGPAAARAAETSVARIERLERMLSASPDHGGLMYRLAVTDAESGRQAEAVLWLEKALAAGYEFDPGDPALASLRGLASFDRLERRLSARPLAHTSTGAFRIAEPDLIPEGIAWDPVGRCLYIGSLYKKKIVRVLPDGTAHDFKTSGQDGLWTVLGMAVDAKRRILWANSTADGREATAAGSAGVFAWDLESARLLGKHVLDGRSGKHLFNDLAVIPEGGVLLTDSESGAIYRIARPGGSLEMFLPPGAFTYPNGIALDASRGRLYVADFGKGISIIDIATKKMHPLAHATGVSIHEIDGLYFFEGALIAIQNGPGMSRVVKFPLDAAGGAVRGVQVIESRNPTFQIPTTGAIVGNHLFYIANTQLERLDDDGRLKPGPKLQDVLILRAPLD